VAGSVRFVPKSDQEPDPPLGAVIKRLREERGESQETLAFRAHTTAGTIGNVELFKAVPGWTTVRMIAAALEIKFIQFVELVEAERDATDGA
jgi:transcriptional regulator with XRE-family HTH domain